MVKHMIFYLQPKNVIILKMYLNAMVFKEDFQEKKRPIKKMNLALSEDNYRAFNITKRKLN